MIFRFPFGGIWTRSPQGLSLLESLESPGKPTGIIQIEMGLPTRYNKHRKNHLRHFLQGYSHIITPIIAFIYDVFWRVFTQGFRLVKHTSSPDTNSHQPSARSLHPSDIRPLRDRRRESVPDPPDACGWCVNSSWPPSGKM